MTLRLFLRKVISRLLFQREFPLSFGHMSFSTDIPYGHVIYKLLGFTLAMVVGPIGTYFLTVDTVFGGMFFSLIIYAEIDDIRQLYICRGNSSDYSECGSSGLCHCCNDGRSERSY